MKRVFWSLSLATILGFAMAQQQDVPPVSTVGSLMSYTGALAEFGPAINNGVTLAVDELNEAATAVFGGPIIELVSEDSATNPSQGVDRARKLINVDGAVAIVGALSSGVTVTTAESVVIPSQVVMISPASTSPLVALLPDDDFVFRTTAADTLQGVVLAQLASGEIVDDLSYERAAIIYVNNPYGQGLADAFTRAFEGRGGTITASVGHPEEPQPTYAGLLDQLLAGDPEVVIAATYPGNATVFMQEARDSYGFTNWMMTDGTKSLDIVEALGAETVEGLYGTAPGADPAWAGSTTFSNAYEAAFGERPPLPYIDTAYDATAVIGLAIAKAYLDGVEINSMNIRDRLREVANPEGEVVGVGEFEEAFRLLELGSAINYTGAAGEVDFDDVGDVITPIEVWQYQGGEIVTVEVLSADQIPAE